MSLQANNLKAGEAAKQILTPSESAQLIKSVTAKHPALNRLQSELKNVGGTSTITSYDRMHHRHNRS